MAVSVRLTAYGAPAFEALAEEVEAARAAAGHFLAPVSVLVGEHRQAVVTRRALARRGLIGVDCLSLRELAERLAGETLAARGLRGATAAVLAGAVRQSLRTPAAGRFGEVRDHLATERALLDAHRALRDLDEPQLSVLAKSSARAADVVAVSREVRRRLAAEGFHDERDLLDAATGVLGGRPADMGGQRIAGGSRSGAGAGSRDALTGLGRVAVYLPQRLATAELGLLAALGSAVEALTVVAGTCGDEAADAPVAEAVRCLAGAAAWLPAVVPPPAPSRVVAAPDADEEVRIALRGVVGAMRRGVPLERMAVLYGRRDPYARLLADQLLAAELPFSGPSPRPLTESVLGRFLLGLLGLAARRYSRADVMAWLSAAPIRAALDPAEDGPWRPVPVAAWERISRRAGVIDGAEEWGRRLAAYSANRRSELDRLGEEGDWRRAHIERDAATADGLRHFMGDVLARAEAADGLGTWRQLAQWAQRSVRDLVGGAQWREAQWPTHERAAAEAVETCVGRLGGLDAVDPDPDLARFRRALEAELTSSGGRHGRTGHGLLVGTVGAALGVDLECVWVLGLAEGVFPGQAVEDALLGETERAAAPGALPVPQSRLADDHRRLLAALAGASRERTLLYPRGDLRRTADRLPSRWLLALARGHPAGDSANADAVIGAGDLRDLLGERFWDVPSPTAALGACEFPPTPQEYDLRLLLDHRARGSSLRDHPLAFDDGPLAAGVALLTARSTRSFTRFDGNLGDCDIVDPGAGERVVSPTQLEMWPSCPHAYFMRYLLGVEPVDQPERELRISALERGDLVHTILDRFLSEVLAAGAPDPESPWGAAERRRLGEIAAEAFAERERQGRVGQRIFWVPERGRILRELLAFLEAEQQWRRAHDCVPWATEKSFGMARRGEGASAPAEVPLGDGRAVRLRGAIDRIDVTAGGDLVVIDYKTGRSGTYRRLGEGPWQIYAGSGRPGSVKREALPRLQLPLYAAAARRIAGTGADVIAGYWFVSAAENFKWLELAMDEAVQVETRWTLANICDGIAAGVFPAYPRPRGHPSHCDYCDADRSRAGELRAQILRKADSPELAGWIRVGARELLAIEEHLRLAEGPPAGTEDGPEERR
ncbi:MAG: hypothetical protein F4X37_03720 [Acidimicrobiia bacterium]|nr:hypothetical protein [Acidimicrobiia bacterium]